MKTLPSPTRAALTLAAALVAPVNALELPAIGPLYAITEEDLLAFIQRRLHEKARSGELAALQEEVRRRAVAQVRAPAPLPGIAAAKARRSYYVDPSFTLGAHVSDSEGRILFPAGTRRNPLEIVALSKHLLFFDGRDAHQVRRARTLIAHYGGRVKPILVAGSYLELMRAWRLPVYFDQAGVLTRRLAISEVPALVSQDGLRLRVDVLGDHDQ